MAQDTGRILSITFSEHRRRNRESWVKSLYYMLLCYICCEICSMPFSVYDLLQVVWCPVLMLLFSAFGVMLSLVWPFCFSPYLLLYLLLFLFIPALYMSIAWCAPTPWRFTRLFPHLGSVSLIAAPFEDVAVFSYFTRPLAFSCPALSSGACRVTLGCGMLVGKEVSQRVWWPVLRTGYFLCRISVRPS